MSDCPNCAANVDEGAVLCPECGFDLHTGVADEVRRLRQEGRIEPGRLNPREAIERHVVGVREASMNTIAPSSLDHVALWVANRDALADFACSYLGMHVIEKTDTFTLVGADARRGKLTLFDADGPRDRGPLERVVLRVRDLDGALAALPDDVEVDRRDGVATFEAPEGLGLGLVDGNGQPGPDFDLDHVVLRVPDPDRTAGELSELGFERVSDGRLAIADKDVRLEQGDAGGGAKPLLNHIAMLVDSAGEVQDEANRRGLEVDKFVDAPNTLAVFLWGPDRIKLEYVEHKPGFALT